MKRQVVAVGENLVFFSLALVWLKRLAVLLSKQTKLVEPAEVATTVYRKREQTSGNVGDCENERIDERKNWIFRISKTLHPATLAALKSAFRLFS